MKKLMALLLAALLLLTACTADPRGQTPTTAPETSGSAPETNGDTAPTTQTTEPPELLPTDPPDPGDYVTTGRQEKITFMDGSKTYSYTLPKLLLGSDDAKAWNSALSQEMGPIFDSAIAYARVSRVGKYATIDYRAWIWADVLTVLVTMPVAGTEQTEYRLGVFDLVTGEALNSGDVFARVTGARTPAAAGEVIRTALETGFDRLHEHIPEEERDKTFTKLQEAITSPENVKATLLFPEEDGSLVAIARIYTPETEEGELRLLPVTDFSATTVSVPPEGEAKLEELVTDYREEELRYRDSLGNRQTVTLRIPQVNINTPDGRDCNWLLMDSLEPPMDKKIAAVEDDEDTKLQEIDYSAWLWSGTLTVLVWMETNVDPVEYQIYVFDLKTGKLLDNAQVAALVGLGAEEYQDVVCQTMLDQYDTLYAGQKQTENYAQRRELTGAGENVAQARLYLDEEGKLMVCGTIYGLAGAGYTNCLMAVSTD